MNKVTIYSLSTCPHCAHAKQFFADRKVPAEVIEFDHADAATQQRIQAELQSHGVQGFPFVKIGSRFVSGYDPIKFAAYLLM